MELGKIMVVDDDKNICELLRLYLEKEGYQVVIANDGKEAVELNEKEDPELILLDIMLPQLDGWQVCREIRKKSQVPIIMLTAKGEVFDKVLGLELGADDYLTKPFHLAELNARVKSLIRRRQAKGDVTVTLGNLLLYPDKRQVEINGKPLQLNRKEFDLLYYFVVNPGRVINKMSLAESVWGDNIDQADSLDFIYSQVKNLRKKLKQAEATIELKAVYGFGYKLSEL